MQSLWLTSLELRDHRMTTQFGPLSWYKIPSKHSLAHSKLRSIQILRSFYSLLGRSYYLNGGFRLDVLGTPYATF